MKAQNSLALLCLFAAIALVAGKKPSKPKPQKFEAEREVVAKKKTFTCKYLLIYKVVGPKFTVDKKKSKVTCSPDSKGNFGVVTETFTIGTKSVQVTHAIKKGKDTVTGLAVAEGKISLSSPKQLFIVCSHCWKWFWRLWRWIRRFRRVWRRVRRFWGRFRRFRRFWRLRRVRRVRGVRGRYGLQLHDSVA